jgi:hypothetical protein
MGINGPVVATLVSTVLLFFPVVWLFLREIGVSAEEWTKDVILPVLPGLALQVGVGLLLLPVAEDTGSLLLVAVLCAVSVLTALAGWVLIGLSKRRRGELIQMIRETAGVGASEPMPEVDLAGDLPTAIDVPLQD